MLKYLVTTILFLSNAAFAEDCIDLAMFEMDSNRTQEQVQTSREADDIKQVIMSLKTQVGLCVSKALQDQPEVLAVRKKNPNLDMKISVESDGKLKAQCDCDTVLKTSTDINEARYRYEAASCYAKLISKSRLSGGKRIATEKTFCWDGKTIYKTAAPKVNINSGVK